MLKMQTQAGKYECFAPGVRGMITQSIRADYGFAKGTVCFYSGALFTEPPIALSQPPTDVDTSRTRPQRVRR